MKIAFFSDTHGTLSEMIADYDFSDVELCVFCGDCYESDFEQLKSLNIPKIGIDGNHPPYEKSGTKRDVFKEYGIVNISWSEFEFQGVKFFGIPWKMSYIMLESIITGAKTYFSNNNRVIEEHKKLSENLKRLHFAKPDILISHFPALGIMDSTDFSHRWLRFLRELLDSENTPKLLIHGHLHEQKEVNLAKTKIVQVFPVRIMEI